MRGTMARHRVCFSALPDLFKGVPTELRHTADTRSGHQLLHDTTILCGPQLTPQFAQANQQRQQQQQQQPQPQQAPYANPPQFNYVFDSPPEQMNNYAFDPNFPPPQPTFRSNSIFCNPASNEPTGRRFSYFPPTSPNQAREPWMTRLRQRRRLQKHT